MIDHQKASQLLVASLAGELDQRSQMLLDGHLERCAECRDWLSTAELLSTLRHTDSVDEGDHPDSEELAIAAADSPYPHRARQPETAEHIETCPECHRLVETIQAALRQARPNPEGRQAPMALLWPGDARWRALLAASLAVIAIGATIVTVRYRTPEQHIRLSGQVISGRYLAEAPLQLTADHSRIEQASDVRLRAGELVVFGEGFSIGENVDLVVEILTATETMKQNHSQPKEY